MLISKVAATRFAAACVGVVALGAASAYALNRDRGLSNAAVAALEASGQDTSQHAILADGVVTPEEHRRALENAVTCIRAAGFDARLEGSAHPGIGIYGPVSRDVVRTCQIRHLDAVAFAWADQIRPTSAELDLIHSATTACFVGRGGYVDVEVLTYVEIQAILSSGSAEQRTALGACLEANREQYGVPY